MLRSIRRRRRGSQELMARSINISFSVRDYTIEIEMVLKWLLGDSRV